MSNIVLITAAGSGRRMGEDRPKQFLIVNGKPLLSYTIEAFNNHPLIDEILIVTNEDYIDEVKSFSNKYSKVKHIIKGGDTRQESVFMGLSFLKENGYHSTDIILIHDGARPLVSEKIITENIKACQEHDAVETVISATDTIIESKDGETNNKTLNRKELFQVQTPQTFKLELIFQAHTQLQNDDATDDAQLVAKLGKEIFLVIGDKKNFKITTKEDLEYFELLTK